ncbi:MAG TPA: sugar phosphate isomerase/epimerase, partial [Bryobacteraceae bacterium]|nr:sugar phosphate isomerase/epimerase [Bryobacteraceae bacterium]
MVSRRSLLASAAAPALLLARPDSRVRGVRLGVQTYSFRDRSIDEAIKATADIGLSYAELWSGHLEPPKGTSAAELTRWRTSPEALQLARDVRRKFNQAGIRVYALSYNMRRQLGDREILACMAMARELGTRYMTSSSTVDQASRLNRLAWEGGVTVAMHNHSNVNDPNEFATPESFARAMAGNERIRVNLDLGHYVAAGFEPVNYLRQNHSRILTLHAKDRRRNQGENVPFGQGDTPLKEVMLLLRDNGWQ